MLASMKEDVVEAPDLTKVLNKTHEDKWVAFTRNYEKILADAESIESLINKLGKKVIDTQKPIFYKVPSSQYSFSPVA
jgi:hypothetical protein